MNVSSTGTTPSQSTCQYTLDTIRAQTNKVVCNLKIAFNKSDWKIYDLGIGAMASFATFSVVDVCFKNAQILTRLVHEIGKENQNEKGPLAVLFMIALLGAASGGIAGYVSRKMKKISAVNE